MVRKVAPKRKEGRGTSRTDMGEKKGALRKSKSDTAINQKVGAMD